MVERMERIGKAVVGLAAVWLGVMATGCGSRSGERVTRHFQSAEVAGERRDHFGLAMEYLFSLDRARRTEDKAIYHLNRWASRQESPPDWSRDPLTQRLLPQFQAMPELKRLDRLVFSRSDRHYIDASYWLRRIADRAVTREVPRLHRRWLREAPELTDGARRRLTEAYQLFDWVVREVSLTPTFPYPRRFAKGPLLSGDALAQLKLPSMAGEPGPGYRFLPWQTLVMGRGDALNRARVTILLGRQRGLDIVLLGVDDGHVFRPAPWLLGVCLEGDLYLFDPQLGLPLPGKAPGSIGRWKELRGLDAWPVALSVGEHQYGRTPADLQRVTALIDASPEALSARMALLEASLPRRYEATLTVHPAEIARRIEECGEHFAGPDRIRLWNVPYEAVLFQRQVKKYIDNYSRLAADDLRALAMVEQLPVLREGRRRHFLGLLNNDGDDLGAKALYLKSRTPNAVLEQLVTSRSAQQKMGLAKGDSESAQQHQMRLFQNIMQRRQAKYYASYWLALAHYDTGMFDVAADWFGEKTLKAFPDAEWNDAARYNLARCFEARGRLDEAVAQLKRAGGPQQLGNLLRSAFLANEAPAD